MKVETVDVDSERKASGVRKSYDAGVMQLFYQKERVNSPCIGLRRRICTYSWSKTFRRGQYVQMPHRPSCLYTEKLAGFPAP